MVGKTTSGCLAGAIAGVLAGSTVGLAQEPTCDAQWNLEETLREVRAEDEQPTFDLLRIGIAGDTLLHRAVPYVPLPVTSDEREVIREWFAAGRAGDRTPDRLRPPWGIRDAERRRRIAREAITFPETHPPVRRILAGRDGSVWLLREAWPRAASLWEVHDQAGNL